jgi:hypothetical protein
MLNAWLMKIMSKRLRDENTCPKDNRKGLKHVGKMTFWKV